MSFFFLLKDFFSLFQFQKNAQTEERDGGGIRIYNSFCIGFLIYKEGTRSSELLVDKS